MRRLWFLVAILLLSAIACSKKQTKEQETYSLDHVSNVKLPPPNHFLHKKFAVTQYEDFQFEVPPHCLNPRLKGTFKTSDDTANIDLYLLDEQQFAVFSQGKDGGSVRTAKSSYQHEVDWALNATFEDPRKYHLVFDNDSGKPKTKYVEADFTVSFE